MKPEEQQLLATVNPSQLMQISAAVAEVCGTIVKKTALQILLALVTPTAISNG
jgi:hypothetical protein